MPIFEPHVKRQTEPVNVDCLDDSELAELIAHPATHLEVRRYAEIISAARNARLSGRIGEATRLETKADRIYYTLPKALRWYRIQLLTSIGLRMLLATEIRQTLLDNHGRCMDSEDDRAALAAELTRRISSLLER